MTDAAENTAELGGPLIIYDIDTLKNLSQRVITNYYDLYSDQYFDNFVPHQQESAYKGIEPIEMIVDLISDDHPEEYKSQYNITEEETGPLQGSYHQIKAWLRYVNSFSYTYRFHVYYPEGILVSNNCFHYTMTQVFDYSTRGNMYVKMAVDREVCDKESILSVTSKDDLFWLSLLAIILTGIHACSTIHYFWVIFKHLGRLQAAFEKKLK